MVISNTTRHSQRAALTSSHHSSLRRHYFLLLSGITSIMPTVTNAFFISTNHHHHHRRNNQLTTSISHRNVHLPKRNSIQLSSTTSDEEQPTTTNNSVTGPIYEMTNDDDNNNNNNPPNIKLFTKEGCTLCDKVKDILLELKTSHPHSLYAVDITDEDKQVWFDKYKYDIPVLHMNEVYWTKHRLTREEAIEAIEEAVGGVFVGRGGEPDAGRLEHG
eukprot:scaffold5098_cov130-Skeletonema_menzelii.AAC.3